MPDSIELQHRCPYLGRRSDPDAWFAFAARENYCHRHSKPRGIALSTQAEMCLSENYVNCPRFRQARAGARHEQPPNGIHPDPTRKASPKRRKDIEEVGRTTEELSLDIDQADEASEGHPEDTELVDRVDEIHFQDIEQPDEVMESLAEDTEQTDLETEEPSPDTEQTYQIAAEPPLEDEQADVVTEGPQEDTEQPDQVTKKRFWFARWIDWMTGKSAQDGEALDQATGERSQIAERTYRMLGKGSQYAEQADLVVEKHPWDADLADGWAAEEGPQDAQPTDWAAEGDSQDTELAELEAELTTTTEEVSRPRSRLTVLLVAIVPVIIGAILIGLALFSHLGVSSSTPQPGPITQSPATPTFIPLLPAPTVTPIGEAVPVLPSATTPPQEPTPTAIVETIPIPTEGGSTQESIFETVLLFDSNLRTGPGTEFETINYLLAGSRLAILGRDVPALWVWVRTEDGQEGWVVASQLAGNHDIPLVPLAPSIPTPPG